MSFKASPVTHAPYLHGSALTSCALLPPFGWRIRWGCTPPSGQSASTSCHENDLFPLQNTSMPHLGALINHDAQNNTPSPSLSLSPLTAQSFTVSNKSLSARSKIYLRAFTNHNPGNAHARIRYILFLLCAHTHAPTHARARHTPTATYIHPHRQGPPLASLPSLALCPLPSPASPKPNPMPHPLQANPRTDPQAPCPVAAHQRPAEGFAGCGTDAEPSCA